MSSVIITGTIESIGNQELIGQKQTPKTCVFIKEVQKSEKSEFEDLHKIEFWGAKADYVGKLKVGDTVSIDTNVKGRRVQKDDGRVFHFTSLQGWKVEVDKGLQPDPQTEEGDDLPF